MMPSAKAVLKPKTLDIQAKRQIKQISFRKIAVVGMGYVGLMIASAFGAKNKVLGYDISQERIAALKAGDDVNGELSKQELAYSNIEFSTNPSELQAADFYIIAVPTPLTDKHPDLRILRAASEMVAKYLKKGDIVVYESSVYPGATEEHSIPILEKISGLVCGKDFGVGYSPERINPADKEHTMATIPKIVSGSDEATLNIIAQVYNSIIPAGVHRVSSIRAAEATKIIENIQRDLNISYVNEVAMILHSLNLSSVEIFEAMKTKWNHLPFRPGLVGGHCIPVNSYYLTHKAEEAGFHPEIILAARRINENMPKYIASEAIKELIHLNKAIKGARIAIFGLSYKENTPDVHDTQITALINELKSYDTEILVYDPVADVDSAKRIHGIDLVSWDKLTNLDAIIIGIGHKEFVTMDKSQLKSLFKNKGLLIDLKGICKTEDFKDSEVKLWQL